MLPQDIPVDVIETVVKFVKTCHPVFETPITLTPSHTIGDALGLVHKRAHGAVVVIDSDGHPVGVFTEHDAAGFDRFTQLRNVMSSDLVTLDADIDPVKAFEMLTQARLSMAPVIDADGRLLGVLTSKGALRSTIYRPAVDADDRLLISVAVGINADPVGPRHGARRDGRRRPRHRHRPRPSDAPCSRSSSRYARPFPARRSSPATS